MKKITLRQGEEFIKLGQALKAAGTVLSGAEAKEVIIKGQVKVNEVEELRRGRKLYKDDIVKYDGHEIKIV